jgi:hypothetical protein
VSTTATLASAASNFTRISFQKLTIAFSTESMRVCSAFISPLIYPEIVEDLEAIMGENTAGDPMSFLKWTCKSTYKIADELNLRGHKEKRRKRSQCLRFSMALLFSSCLC